MKKRMLTLALVALSSLSLSSVCRQETKPISTRPIITSPVGQTQPSGTTAFMDPALSECLQRKGTGQMTQEEAQRALQECRDEIYDEEIYGQGDLFADEAGADVTE